MNKKEQIIAKTDWIIDNGLLSKRRGKKLAAKRIRRAYKNQLMEE